MLYQVISANENVRVVSRHIKSGRENPINFFIAGNMKKPHFGHISTLIFSFCPISSSRAPPSSSPSDLLLLSPSLSLPRLRFSTSVSLVIEIDLYLTSSSINSRITNLQPNSVSLLLRLSSSYVMALNYSHTCSSKRLIYVDKLQAVASNVSIMNFIKRAILDHISTSLSAHNAPLPLHSNNQRCIQIYSTRLLR